MKNPIDRSLKTEILPVAIVLAGIGLSLWAYPHLSAQVVTHWNFQNQPNGWSSREFHSILFPGILVAIYLLFNVLPSFDPKNDRYREFAGVYRAMRNMILLVFLTVFAASTFSNLGYPVNIGAIVSGAIGLMMVVLGNYFGKLKRNFFIGLRTPWTLSSDNVWNRTHRLGGRLFIAWGFGLMLAPWLSSTAAFIILLGGLALIIAWINIYSYRLFKKEQPGAKNQ